MKLYVVLAGALLILWLFMRNLKNGMKWYFRIALVILFFVSTLREAHIGTDYPNYTMIFGWTRISGFSVGYEYGYILLNMLANLFSEHYVALAATVNLLMFGSFYWFNNKFVEDRYKGLIIFIFFMNPYLYIQCTFNILRQGCATAVLMIALCYLYERKWRQYIIAVLMAAQFHKISYVFLLMIGFRLYEWDRKKFFILSSVSVVMNLFLSNDRFISLIASILGFGGYIGYEKSMFDFKLYTVFVYLVILFFLSFYNKLYREEKEKFFVDLYLFSLSLLPLFVKNDVAYRVYIILVFLSLPAVTYIWEAFKYQTKKLEYITVIFGYLMYYFVFFVAFFERMIQSHNIHYVPFRFFWQG